MKKYTLGFSPCPNDTFIFDALVNKKIDTDLEFEVVLADVQQLNKWALEGKLDFTKISYGVMPLLTTTYKVLSSGGALGKGVGPLLITKNPDLLTKSDLSEYTVAIPGQNTTAHLLFSLAHPECSKKEMMIFSDIEDAVLTGKTDMGVIIHENRFTYQSKGLYKIKDLGNYWEETTGNPIPLGGIVAKNSLDTALMEKVNAQIKASIEYAYAHHYPAPADYVKAHSQEMEPDVMKQHIDLYVNNFSLNLGSSGKAAVNQLIEIYQKNNPGLNISPVHYID